MASDTRKKDIEWSVVNEAGNAASWETVQVAVLMDIRDELKRLNGLLHCGNFIGIPAQLRDLKPIARMARRANTNAAKRRKAAK